MPRFALGLMLAERLNHVGKGRTPLATEKYEMRFKGIYKKIRKSHPFMRALIALKGYSCASRDSSYGLVDALRARNSEWPAMLKLNNGILSPSLAFPLRLTAESGYVGNIECL